MTVVETAVGGVLILEAQAITDERGFFARTWDRAVLEQRGLTAHVAQVSIAYNELAGTLRGLHLQMPPHEEAKTVRCTKGAIYDVAVDLREGSRTRLGWVGVELSESNHRGLFIPEGCAHGYVTLTDRTEVEYMISVPYAPDSARGYRWDDPSFAIEWPVQVSRISQRDRDIPLIE